MKNLLICSIWIFGLVSALMGFNLDFEYTVLKSGPDGSFFGFSVAEHQESSNKWLLVGAPKANNTFLQFKGSSDKSSGTVFKCNASSPSFDCIEEVKFDSNPSSDRESKSNAWMGVSLKSQGPDMGVLTCAHRYEYYGQLKNFRLLEGKCYQVSSSLKSGEAEYNPCNSYNNEQATTPNHENYGQCQTGIGMDVYPKLVDDETVASFGSVGAKTWTGRLFEMDTDDGKTQAELPNNKAYRTSYFGYAVAYGKYFSTSELDIAVGGPRHGSYGQVILYLKSDLAQVKQFIPENEDEVQIGSGYGISVCAMDADNNGLSELVVGAPFYAPENAKGQPDTGAVYIYHKLDGSDKLVLQKKLFGTKKYSNFGYAVTNAGDINQDAYEDLIVGAPHENNGMGAVYVFQGSNVGLTALASQHVEASKIVSGLTENIGLKGFGRSIAAGLDMDENGYKDVLVGAYASNHVVLLRSRPVVKTSYSMAFNPNEINLKEKNCSVNNGLTTCFTVRFCHNYSEPSMVLNDKGKIITVKYTIIADPKASKPRVRFIQNNKNTYTFYVRSSVTTKCKVIKNVYLVYNEDGSIAEYPDLHFGVQVELPYGDGPEDIPKPARTDLTIPSLDAYPVLMRTYQDGKISTGVTIDLDLRFKRECTACIPDLSMATEAKNYTLRLGSKTFRFNVSIENKGVDPGFSVGLKFNLPPDIELDNIVIDGTKSVFCQKDICEDVFNKFKSGEKKTVGIILNTRSFGPTSANNITVEVTSANKEDEATMLDNKISIDFDIKVVADIETLGVVSTQQVLYEGKVIGESAVTSLEDAGQMVEHKFAVRNNGPDLLPKAKMVISWPFETVSGKHLLYIVSVTKSSRNVKCDIPTKDINSLNLKTDGSSPRISALSNNDPTANKRTRRNVDNVVAPTPQPATKPSSNSIQRKKDGIILDCFDITAKCYTITCTIENLLSQETATVTLNSRLWEASLLLDYYGDVLTIVSHASAQIGTNASYISDPDLLNNQNELYTVVNPVFAKKAKESGIKKWQIALAAVAGILLLALLIFGLYKVGFFKRQRSYKNKKDDSDKALLGKNKNGLK